MKVSLCIFILLSIHFSGYCQHQKKLTFNFIEGIELNIPTSNRIVYNQYENTFIYCKSMFENDGDSVYIMLYKLNLLNKNNDSIKVALPKNNSIMRWSINALEFNSDYLGIMADSIYVFDLSLNSFRTFNRHRSDDFKILDDKKLLLYKNYNSHPLDDSIKTKILKYDILSGTLEKSVTPSFKYILYTHFVQDYFAYSKRKLAFAQTIPYNIDIYSTTNLTVQKTISGSLINQDTVLQSIDNLHLTSLKNHNAKKNYASLKSIDSNTSRIEKIFFLDDTHLLVSKKFPESNNFDKRLLDVWEYKSNSWHCVIKDQMHKEIFFDNDETISSTTLPLNLTYSSKIFFDNNTVYTVNSKIPPKMNILVKERDAYYDTYYSNNDLNYFLWIYNWEIK